MITIKFAPSAPGIERVAQPKLAEDKPLLRFSCDEVTRMLRTICALLVCFGLLSEQGCSGHNGIVPGGSTSELMSRVHSQSGHLYVLAQHEPPHIFVFAQASKTLEATIKPEGYGDRIYQIATDGQGNLYALGGSAVLVYAEGKTNVTRVINVGGDTMVVGSDGTVYASAGGPIAVISPGATTATKTITSGIVHSPLSMTFDNKGNLYVLQCNCVSRTGFGGAITEYQAGSLALINTIKLRWNGWGQIAADDQGDVYVSNYWGNRVQKFQSGSTKADLVITKGVSLPAGMVVDSAHNLYVVSPGGRNGKPVGIAVYAPNETSPSRTITSGQARKPSLLAPVLDAKGNLYVGGALGVSMFSPGVSEPSLKLFAENMRGIWDLAIGP